MSSTRGDEVGILISLGREVLLRLAALALAGEEYISSATIPITMMMKVMMAE